MFCNEENGSSVGKLDNITLKMYLLPAVSVCSSGFKVDATLLSVL